jgi:hypothetical protein
VRHAHDVLAVLRRLDPIAGSPAHAELIGACLRHLDLFRLSRQIATINQTLEHLNDMSRRATRRRAIMPRTSGPSAGTPQ